jgi:biopolymer transport protein ExbB/TolQ
MEDAVLQKRFLCGVALAWAPWVPTIIGLGYVFRGVWQSKATGIAAIAGGLAEGFVWWGVVAMIIGQVTAIVLMARTFSGGRWIRNLLSALSICMSGLMLILVGCFLAAVCRSK